MTDSASNLDLGPDVALPTIEFLFTADAAEAANGKLYVMGGAAERRYVQDFAQPQSFSVVVSISIPWNDTNRPIPLILSVMDYDGGAVLAPWQTNVMVGRPANARFGQPQRFMMALNLITVLPKAGEYVVEARLDDKHLKRFTFVVEAVGR